MQIYSTPESTASCSPSRRPRISANNGRLVFTGVAKPAMNSPSSLSSRPSAPLFSGSYASPRRRSSASPSRRQIKYTRYANTGSLECFVGARLWGLHSQTPFPAIQSSFRWSMLQQLKHSLPTLTVETADLPPPSPPWPRGRSRQPPRTCILHRRSCRWRWSDRAWTRSQISSLQKATRGGADSGRRDPHLSTAPGP